MKYLNNINQADPLSHFLKAVLLPYKKKRLKNKWQYDFINAFGDKIIAFEVKEGCGYSINIYKDDGCF